LLPIAIRLCNHSFLKFLGVMFRRTNRADCASRGLAPETSFRDICFMMVRSFLSRLLNANHRTEVPSRINVYLSRNVLGIRVPRSVRENYLNLQRDLPDSLLFVIHFLSNGCEKEITQHRIKCELPVHASNRTHQLSDYEHRLSPASNKS